MKKIFMYLLIVLIGVGIGWMGLNAASTSSNQKMQQTYEVASLTNPDGYWGSIVTSAYKTETPTGVIYTFRMFVDSLLTTAYIDIPMWKHWGKVMSYEISLHDTGAGWTPTDDSVHVMIRAYALAGDGDTQLIKTIADSGTAVGSGVITTWVLNGEIDLSVEQYYWERLKIHAVQSNTNANGNDTLYFDFHLTAPFSDQYMASPYYKEAEGLK